MYNKLLQSQINKHLGSEQLPDPVKLVLEEVNASYIRFEKEREALEHAARVNPGTKDTSARKEAEENLYKLNELLTLKAERNLVYQKTLLELSSSQRHDKANRFRELARAAALSVDTQRVSIWFYNITHTVIECECLYLKTEDRFESGATLYEKDFPSYFAALAKNRVIPADDAHTHPATHEFSAVYLKPLGIASMLDVPVRQSGEIIGVVCIEHTGKPRTWYEEDQLFAASIADLVTLAIETSERRLAELKLEEQNKELKKTNAELDRFVYSVSHDLRAPLSSMLGILEISRGETDDANMLNNLSMMSKSVHKLDSIILDILDYSRNARLEIAREKIDFHELVSAVSHDLKNMGGAVRKPEINIQVNALSPFYSDKDRLGIIFTNLLSNAMWYQNPAAVKPTIDIEIQCSDKSSSIKVRDNGIGIRKEYQTRIFDMFFRASLASSGSGLGLYIVKEAVTKLNGTIEVMSEPGEGSTFIVQLPGG